MTFHIYMSVYLMRPDNAPDASTLLKYMHKVRNILESNSDQYELLLNVAQHPVPRVTS